MHRPSRAFRPSFTLAPAVAAFAALCATALPLPAQGTTYHVTTRAKVGGEGGWDYLTADPAMHRVFLSRSTHVMVYDTEKDSVLFDIPNTPGVHGVALAPELNRGFTSNGRDSSVTIFDYRTLATLGVIHGTGANPDAILYDPTTQRLFTFNGRSADATAIDAKTGAILGTVPLGGKPETGNHDGHGRIFVNVEDKNEVVVFDARTLAVEAHWALPGCEAPTGQAIDRATLRLFLGCGDSKTMVVVDYTAGKVVASVGVGDGVDAAFFDAPRKLVFTPNGGDGTMSVIHQDAADRYTLVGTVPTQRGARTMTLDERTHKLYTVAAEYGPAPAAAAGQRPQRAPMIPGSFTVLVLVP
jgi:DNA-binding beta-propeller fold protein YncE